MTYRILAGTLITVYVRTIAGPYKDIPHNIATTQDFVADTDHPAYTIQYFTASPYCLIKFTHPIPHPVYGDIASFKVHMDAFR